MNPTLLVKMRPTTLWRIGPDSGSSSQAGAILHSDALYAAVCSAMSQLGLLDEWLNATARPYGEPAVRFSSAFPFQRHLLFVPRPSGLWPPVQAAGSQSRLRWKGAALIPFDAAMRLIKGEPLLDEEWTVDPETGCLLPSISRAATGPYRLLRRSFAAVDRTTGGQVQPWSTACMQFAPGSGLWAAIEFSSQQTYAIWTQRVQAAFRLLADTGIGGLRSRGFGRFRAPEFQAGLLNDLLPTGVRPDAAQCGWWLLSLFSPGHDDDVQWGAGRYTLVTRGGRSQSGEEKLTSRLVCEGSVLVSGAPLRGTVQDVAAQGASHPVYRAAYAVALPVPWQVTA